MANRAKAKNLETGRRIRELRIKAGLTQKDLAERLYKSESAVRMWELGKSEPDLQSINLLAEIFNIDPSYLTGWDRPTILGISTPVGKRHPLNLPQALRIPVLGYVAAGIPLEAIEDIIDYEEIPEQITRDGSEYFALQIKGQSMEPKISDGDVVIVRKQPDVDSGQIAIVCVNGDHATCKKVMKQPGGILLQPLNPAYEATFYSTEDIVKIPITILGRVVELRAKF